MKRHGGLEKNLSGFGVLTALFAVLLIGCGGGGSGPGPDTIPPAIVSTTPADGTTNVPVDAIVEATFTEPVDPGTVDGTTVKVRAGAAEVAGTFCCVDDTLTFTPSANWGPATTYTITVSGGPSGVRDLAGNPLAADHTWRFSTGRASGTKGFAYAVNQNSNSISQFTIGSDGKLAPMSPATVAAGDGPYAIAVDPWGNFAYVANRSNVSQFSIGVDGTLTTMSSATVTAGVAPNHVMVDPSGRFAYVVNSGDDTISQFTIGADGMLTPLSPATVAAGDGPSFIAVDPSGRFAYVTNWGNDGFGNTVSQYSIGADGKLIPMSPATVVTGQGPNSVAFDPSGRFAYVANAKAPAGVAPPATHTLTNNVSQFSIGVDGKLTPMSPATVWTGLSPYSIAVDPSGRFVYVANYWDDNVSQYTIATDGKLAPMTPAKVAAGNGPFCVVVDPGGEFAYVANSGDDTISRYTIGPDGKLAPMSPATVAAGGGPVYLATTIHPWRYVRILGGI